MSKKLHVKNRKIAVVICATIIVCLGVYLAFQNANFAVLNPRGSIADQQLKLMINATLLMLVVIIPVFVLTFMITWKYRAGNKKAKYSPDMDGNRLFEVTWWLIPLAIIIALSTIIWKSSYALDPYRPLESSKKPVRVQVIALEWKWLFIYPDENIVTVNQLQIPVGTPVNFEITSDAPMNSFWIPQLGGQVYAMAGMTTKLHLDANKPGDYQGSSANISGEGFSGMRFIARASSEQDYKKWAENIRGNGNKLDFTDYNNLAKPSKNNAPAAYTESDQNIYDKVIMKYMSPGKQEPKPSEHFENEGAHHY